MTEQLLRQSNLDFETAKRRARRRDFTPLILQPTFTAHYSVNLSVVSSKNVIRTLPRKVATEETVIYSAHWDLLGVGQPDPKGDRIYNGA